MSSKKLTLFFSALMLFSKPDRAPALTLDPSSFSSPLQFMTEQAASASATALGLGGEFKPLTGVDPPSGPLGFEIGASAQIAKIPDEFRDVLASAGFSSTIPAVLPATKVQANLRLGDRVAVEGGWLKVNDFKLAAIALKIKILSPEEGFGTAIRLAYADNDLGILSSRTWSPAILFGGKLDFAEPYFGASYSFAAAKIEFPLTVNGVTQTFTASGKANGLSIFGGLIFDLAVLQIAFEGNYSNAGVPGLAARIGMRF